MILFHAKRTGLTARVRPRSMRTLPGLPTSPLIQAYSAREIVTMSPWDRIGLLSPLSNVARSILIDTNSSSDSTRRVIVISSPASSPAAQV